MNNIIFVRFYVCQRNISLTSISCFVLVKYGKALKKNILLESNICEEKVDYIQIILHKLMGAALKKTNGFFHARVKGNFRDPQ